jgi:hypothetical protein
MPSLSKIALSIPDSKDVHDCTSTVDLVNLGESHHLPRVQYLGFGLPLILRLRWLLRYT